VDVEPAKLYIGVGPSDLDSGIAEITQPAYFGQLNQLRSAAPTQSVSSFVGYPPAVDMGAGTASVPSWNHSTGSWVQAPQGPSPRVQPQISVESWEAGFMHEACGMWLTVGPVGATQLSQLAMPPEYRLQTTSSLAGGRMTSQMPKLQHFDGSGSLDTFLPKFQSMASYLRRNEEDAMYHLCGSLEGAAGQVLWDIGPRATTADVVQLLQTRFGTQLQVERFKVELRTM